MPGQLSPCPPPAPAAAPFLTERSQCSLQHWQTQYSFTSHMGKLRQEVLAQPRPPHHLQTLSCTASIACPCVKHQAALPATQRWTPAQRPGTAAARPRPMCCPSPSSPALHNRGSSRYHRREKERRRGGMWGWRQLRRRKRRRRKERAVLRRAGSGQGAMCCGSDCAEHRRARAGGDRAAPGCAHIQPFPSPLRASGGSSSACTTGRSRVPAAGRCRRGQVRQGMRKSSTPNGS